MSTITKWVAGIIIVAVLAGGGYAIFHKSSNNSNNSYGSGNQTSNTGTSNQTSSSGDIIQTKSDSSVGQYLTDGNGETLYTYSADSNGVSNCTGACLSNWPAYTARTNSGNLPANVTIITRSDNGTFQYAYKGKPLYYFTSDTHPGQITGNNVENFTVAKP